MFLRWTALLLGLLTAGGCAAPFHCPARGGPPWRELSSEHFSVFTDVAGEDAAVALRDLEEYRSALMATAFPGGGDAGGRARVLIVAGERHWREFESERDGLFTEALHQPFIALRAAASDRTRITIRHELTHHLSRMRIPQQPDWLSEGLATFFESLVYDRSSGEVLIGLPLPGRMAALRSGGFSVERTMSGTRSDAEAHIGHQGTDRFYATSWLIVHYLMSRQSAPFAGYLRRLESGQPSEAAWSASFPDLGPSVLQAEVRAHRAEGRPLVASQRFRAPPFTMQERPVDEPTVHALRALLFSRGPGQSASPSLMSEARQRAEAEVAEALSSDGQHLLALSVRSLALEQQVDVETARALTRRHPGSWLAWRVLHRASGDDLATPEARKAAAIAARLAATDPLVKLPFSPSRKLLGAGPSGGGVEPPGVACAAPVGDPRRKPSVAGCPGDRTAELRLVAESEVAWCLFEQTELPMMEVALELEPSGRPRSICLVPAATGDPTLACVQRALSGLTFPVAAPASSACRHRRFELVIAADGRLTVFAR